MSGLRNVAENRDEFLFFVFFFFFFLSLLLLLFYLFSGILAGRLRDRLLN
jgi:hypothetical protein